MAEEPEDAEALRWRLYRPGASAADLSSYLEATGPAPTDAIDARSEPPRGPSGRPFVVGAIAVGCAAVLGGLLLSGALTPFGPGPEVAAATTAAPAPAPATSSFEAGGDQVGFMTATVLDGGSAPHAMGSAVQEGPDRYRYTVVAGDTVEGVGGRFGVCAGDVLVALPYGTDPARLPPDQTVEIAKLTSTTC